VIPAPLRVFETIAALVRSFVACAPPLSQKREGLLADLKRRVAAARWPDKETDQSHGVQLATVQSLARYWATNYDWRKVEAKLNALPQFITEIDVLSSKTPRDEAEGAR
jgi:Epoxide hydrolase N terminus